METKLICLVGLACLFLANLSAQEIDTKKLEALIQYNDSLYASEVLVIHKGEEIAYWRDTTCHENMKTSSMLKSWSGLAFGTLVDKGLIHDLDEKVCTYLPEWQDGCEKQVSLRQLLNMSAGLNRRGPRGVLSQEDMNAYVLSTKLDTFPNVRWNYSNESVQLLGIILERVSGMDANSYYKKYLFEPLGMKNTNLITDNAGNWVTYGGCSTTIHEAAQIALLLRNKGVHKGKRVISEDWLDQSLAPSPLFKHYGFLWWVDLESTHRRYVAMGDPGNIMVYFPGLDLIFLRAQACKNDFQYNLAHWMNMGFYDKISGIVSGE